MPLTAIRRYTQEQCIQRSDRLIDVWPSAREVLKTYKQVLEFRISFHTFLEKRPLNIAGNSQRLPSHIDFGPFIPQFRELLQTMSSSTPPGLVEGVNKLRTAGSDYWLELVERHWIGHDDNQASAETFFAQTFLQPLAEHLAQEAAISTSNYARPICPYCERKPVCGVLRPEGDGAKRSLICSFCGTEWEYRRLICPACEQEDVHRLPVYTAETFSYVRVEACDVCHAFIKTIDLTKDGRAIPVVDEIASVPLTLWAQEKGYEKFQRNVLLM